MVAHIRERDPKHFAWANLFPTYASNEQLGTQGDTIAAYNEHLRQFVETVKPSLISYDHYHFRADGGDGDQYFLNLALVRSAALKAGVPFLNIIQACSWSPSVRVPKPDELRFLTYTSLAYGAMGIAHYVYSYPTDHRGMIADTEGKPTELYYAGQKVNPEFERIGAQVQSLESIGAYHVGDVPTGAEKLADDADFRLEPPPVTSKQHDPPGEQAAGYYEGKTLAPLEGFVLGYFGKDRTASHVLVVNLDYKHPASTTLIGPEPLEVYDPSTDQWSPAKSQQAKLDLPAGGGVLVRISGSSHE
jgi:hypothetical protein